MSPTKRRRRSRRHLFTVAAVLFVGALSATLFLWWSGRVGSPAPPVIDLTSVDPAVRRRVEDVRAAVLQSPASADAWGKLGMVLQSHGLGVEASNLCFAQAERLDPRQPRWPYLQATSLLNTDPETALPKLKRAVELCDCEPDAPRLQLAELLLDRGRLEEAEEQFQRVRRRDPDNARAALGLGRIAFQRGELPESITLLNRSAADIHTRKAAHILMAQTYERLGNTAASEQALRRANELPNDQEWPDRFQDEVVKLRVGKQALLAQADRLLHQGRFPEALKLLERTVLDYPDSAWAWVMMGRAHSGKNDYPAAEKALRKATELDPELAEAHFYLGVTFFFQKNYQAATTSFRKATALKPDFARAHYNLGHSLREQGDDAAALASFRTAIGCQPGYAAAHYNLAQLLIKKGQRDEAVVHLRHAVQLNPSDRDAKKLLEQVQKQGGGPAER